MAKSFIILGLVGCCTIYTVQASDWLPEWSDVDWGSSNIATAETSREDASLSIAELQQEIRDKILRTKEREESFRGLQESIRQQIANLKEQAHSPISIRSPLGLDTVLAQSPRSKPEMMVEDLQTPSMIASPSLLEELKNSKPLRHVPIEEVPMAVGGLKHSTFEDSKLQQGLSQIHLRRAGSWSPPELRRSKARNVPKSSLRKVQSAEATSLPVAKEIPLPLVATIRSVPTEPMHLTLGYVNISVLGGEREAERPAEGDVVFQSPVASIETKSPAFNQVAYDPVYDNIRRWNVHEDNGTEQDWLAFHQRKQSLHSQLRFTQYLMPDVNLVSPSIIGSEKDLVQFELGEIEKARQHLKPVVKIPRLLLKGRGSRYYDLYLTALVDAGVLPESSRPVAEAAKNVTLYNPDTLGAEGKREQPAAPAPKKSGWWGGFKIPAGSLKFDFGVLEQKMSGSNLAWLETHHEVSTNWVAKSYLRRSFAGISQQSGFILVDDVTTADGKTVPVTVRGYFEVHRRLSEGRLWNNRWTKSPADDSCLLVKNDHKNIEACRLVLDTEQANKKHSKK